MITPLIGWTLTLVVCGGAALRGGREERLAAGALMAGFALTLVLRDRTWSGTQWTGLWIDVAFLAVLVAIALRSLRFWPLFASGFQLLSVITHLARTLDPGVRSWAYASAGILWTWLVMVAIGFGVLAAWRDRRLARAQALAAQ